METNLSLPCLNDALFPISGKIIGPTFLLITEGVFFKQKPIGYKRVSYADKQKQETAGRVQPG